MNFHRKFENPYTKNPICNKFIYIYIYIQVYFRSLRIADSAAVTS